MEEERMFVKCDKHHHKLLQCLAPDKLNFQAYKVSGRCYRWHWICYFWKRILEYGVLWDAL